MCITAQTHSLYAFYLGIVSIVLASLFRKLYGDRNSSTNMPFALSRVCLLPIPGEELRKQVCGKLGVCREVPFIGSYYATPAAFSNADDGNVFSSSELLDGSVVLSSAYKEEQPGQ